MEGGHLPLVTPGLVYGTALPPPDEDAGDLCRICFGPDESDATGDPADQFISPCKCSGKFAKHVCRPTAVLEKVLFICTVRRSVFSRLHQCTCAMVLMTGRRLNSAHPLLMPCRMAAAALCRAGLQALAAVRNVSYPQCRHLPMFLSWH